jgi:hypothetical protein
MWWTSRGVDDRTNLTYDKIKTLTNQKTLEDSLFDPKPPETPDMTLEPHLAAKAFHDMLFLWQDAGNSWTSPQLCPASQLERT